MVPLLLAAALASHPARATTERTFERVKDSVFTIEVHSGNDGAKSTLGSGYLVSPRGLIVTNYHVVGGYVDDPDRFSIRARNQTGEYDARLVHFDLINDLAVLEVPPPPAAPLLLGRERPPPGAHVVAFGNPEGLGLSLIEGIANGFAEKGLVDRMLLSMPLNSGMSGGPILNTAGDVVGTNVSVMWLSNSLSFGVPADKIAPLLARPPLRLTAAALREETARQLAALEQTTSSRLLEELARMPEDDTVTVGDAVSRRPPDVFDCWDSSETHADEGIDQASYGCDLQFTPAVEGVGEVASVELLLEHFRARSQSVGFYGYLQQHGGEHHDVEAVDPGNGIFSAPRCVPERVRVRDLTWMVNTCTSAYVSYPGFLDFDLTATTVSRPLQAAHLALHAHGFRTRSFAALTRRVLEGIRLEGKR